MGKPMGYSASSNRSSYGLSCGFWSNSQVPSQSLLVVWTLSDLSFSDVFVLFIHHSCLISYDTLNSHPFARVLDVFTACTVPSVLLRKSSRSFVSMVPKN